MKKHAEKQEKTRKAAALIQMFARRICTDTTEFLKRQLPLDFFGQASLIVQEIALTTRNTLKRWWQKARKQAPIMKEKKPHQLVLELNELHQLRIFH